MRFNKQESITAVKQIDRLVEWILNNCPEEMDTNVKDLCYIEVCNIVINLMRRGLNKLSFKIFEGNISKISYSLYENSEENIEDIFRSDEPKHVELYLKEID